MVAGGAGGFDLGSAEASCGFECTGAAQGQATECGGAAHALTECGYCQNFHFVEGQDEQQFAGGCGGNGGYRGGGTGGAGFLGPPATASAPGTTERAVTHGGTYQGVSTSGINVATAHYAKPFINGGVGGAGVYSDGQYGWGGFGGGGGAGWPGMGGGGGFSGGGASYGTDLAGGGGGSKNAGEDQVNTAGGAPLGEGSVTITCL